MNLISAFTDKYIDSFLPSSLSLQYLLKRMDREESFYVNFITA